MIVVAEYECLKCKKLLTHQKELCYSNYRKRR